MAAAATDSNGGGEGEAVIIMSGALTKQGNNVIACTYQLIL